MLLVEGVLDVPEVCAFLTTTLSVLCEEEVLGAFSEGDGSVPAAIAAAVAAAAAPPTAAAAAAASTTSSTTMPPAIVQPPNPARLAAPTPYNQQCALALYDYESDEPGALALHKGQSILVLTRERDAEWCWCRREIDGVEGWCPVAFINDGTPFTRPRATARQLAAPPPAK